jgi:ribonuclease T
MLLLGAANPSQGLVALSAFNEAARTAELFCAIVNRWRRLETLERDQVGLTLT